MVSPETYTHDNLPLSLTSFVGRKAELEDLREMVFRERLLTLTGFGGSGKTRLALEVARGLSGNGAERRTENPGESIAYGTAGGIAREFPDGIWLVDLGPIADPSLVAAEVASAVGVLERVGRESGRETVQELAAALGERRCLILLDNCEHLAEACARLAEGLLGRCGELAVLATAREPLRAAGEVVWPVSGLSVPELRPGPQHGSLSPVEAVSSSESGRLFVERATASSGFELTEKNAPAVAEVCRRLEGVPLAIELAAARTKSMAVAQISTRLDDALALLTSGPRTASPRQSTLRATLDWSHDLLSPAEQVFFRNLSVFNGGFTLEAAEEVCGAEPEDGAVWEAIPAIDFLSQLVDKSLVQVQRTGEEARYYLLEVIRQYASEKLEEAGEVEALRRRHAIFFRDFAEEAEPQLHGPDRGFWLDLVDDDLDNFRAAMSWATEAGEAGAGLRIASGLAGFWLRRGRLAEGRAAAERALEVGAESEDAAPAPAEPEAVWVAEALHVAGGLAWAQGDWAAACPPVEAAVARFRELGDEARLFPALSTYSVALFGHGEIEQALAVGGESVALGRRSSQDDEGNGFYDLARVLATLGFVRVGAGDFEGAIPSLEESASLCRSLEDGWLLSLPLLLLGVMAFKQEEYERAQSVMEESVKALRDLGEHFLLSNALMYLAVVLAARGSARKSARLFGASEALREAVGQGIYPQYRADYDRGVERVRTALGEEAFASAWAEGREMDAETVISYALDENEHAEEEPSTPTLRVLALGQAQVEVGGRVVEGSGWGYAKVTELFFYLISHPPRTREKIGLDLWPDASPLQLRNALHSALHRLRKALGHPNRVRYTGGRYAFDRALPFSYDVADFEEKTRQAHQRVDEEPEAAADLLEEAAGLYGGDFLEGFGGGEWVFVRQQELRESYIEGQLLLGQIYTEQGKNTEAVRAYKRAIAYAPYSGKAHAGLIRAYSRLGRQGRAFQHYQDLEEALKRDLSSKLPPEVASLIECLRRGEEL